MHHCCSREQRRRQFVLKEGGNIGIQILLELGLVANLEIEVLTTGTSWHCCIATACYLPFWHRNSLSGCILHKLCYTLGEENHSTLQNILLHEDHQALLFASMTNQHWFRRRKNWVEWTCGSKSKEALGLLLVLLSYNSSVVGRELVDQPSDQWIVASTWSAMLQS